MDYTFVAEVYSQYFPTGEDGFFIQPRILGQTRYIGIGLRSINYTRPRNYRQSLLIHVPIALSVVGTFWYSNWYIDTYLLKP